MKNKMHKQLYAWVVVLIPVLYQYSIVGGYLDLDVIAMVMVLFFNLFREKTGFMST